MDLNKLYEEAIYKAKISILESEYYRLTAENEELRKQLAAQKSSEETPTAAIQQDLDVLKKRFEAEAEFDKLLDEKLIIYKPAYLNQKQSIVDLILEHNFDFDDFPYKVIVKKRSVQFTVLLGISVERGLTISHVMVGEKYVWKCPSGVYIDISKWGEFIEVGAHCVERMQKSPDIESLFHDELVRKKLL